MRVLFIIPAAFTYFEDSSAKAFALGEKLTAQGITVQPFTVQYGQPSKSFKTSVETGVSGTGAGFAYAETLSLSTLEEALRQADLVHVHVPFLGFGHELISFKKKFPKCPFVVTWYGPVRYTDLFSLFVRAYNAYYVPKIFKITDGLVQPFGKKGTRYTLFKNAENVKTLTNEGGGVQLQCRELFEIKELKTYLELVVQYSCF